MDALHHLASALGISVFYDDAFGERREALPDVLRLTCAALGFDAHDGATLQNSLRRLQNERARELVPPVITLRGARPLDIPLTIIDANEELRVDWTLCTEFGDMLQGSITWRDLAPVENGKPAAAGQQRILRVADRIDHGYHDLSLRAGRGRTHHVRVIAAPAQAYQPPLLERYRAWVLSTQLYSLKTENDWGIGDLGALASLLDGAARCGASGIGLNPLHALFPDEPARASPYSPSSRMFLNPLYLDVAAIEDFQECEEAQQLVTGPLRPQIRRLREQRLVDYEAVAAVKEEVLQKLYTSFRTRHLDHPDDSRGQAFREFQAQRGAPLRRFAIFEVLRQKFGAQDASLRYWRNWPEDYRQPDGAAVHAFAQHNLQKIEYVEYLQWQTERQLAVVRTKAEALGLSIGIYGDLAIGIDTGGADAWADQDVIVAGFSCGAPPDTWTVAGQDWGFPPLNPRGLRQSGYRFFGEVLAANMRHAGALRIDHVLGLMRMFWIPQGRPAADGVYVAYPFDELITLVILESHRNKCLVVGEDLGTLPPGVHEALHDAGLYSYRLLFFERHDDHGFKAPAEFPALAAVAVSTHDLPTLAGYWSGADIALRERFGMIGSGVGRLRAEAERARDRTDLVAALRKEEFTIPDVTPDAPRDELYRYIARTPSRLAIVQIDDAIDEHEQINLPGTENEHPNWRRRYTKTLSDILAAPRTQTLFAAMREERPPHAPKPRANGHDHGALSPFARRHQMPVATYRLQLNKDFDFAATQRVLPYLANLGVSHLYVSPFTRARPGSTHGYDVADHTALNPEIGDEAALASLSNALAALDMGMILDFVPNHMGIGSDNDWWLDVLEWGAGSPYARFFDIDWHPSKRELWGKVLVPVLGDHYGVALERGELTLRFSPQDGSFSVWYFDNRLPVRPSHYSAVIRRALADIYCGADEAARLRVLADAFAKLRTEGLSRRRQTQVHERAGRLKAELAEFARAPDAAAWLERAAALFNGTPGQATTFRPLHALLERQYYRLAFWRVAANEINYRRFFDINGLIGIRQEEQDVFHHTHRLIGDLVAQDRIQGLRIDHVDGLFDPAGYCRDLRQLVDAKRAAMSAGGGTQSAVADGRFPIYVEKILGRHEALRTDWAVDGTTGYDFLALLNRVFIHPDAAKSAENAFRNFAGEAPSFDGVLHDSKRLVMDTLLASELEVLASALDRLAEQNWRTRDYTLERLRRAIIETVTHFSVYRTYVTAAGCSSDDRKIIDTAISRARHHWSGPDHEILDFLQSALTLDLAKDRRSGYNRNDVAQFAMRFQQFSAPVMAKGLEDTAGYRYQRFLSLNEVGSEPDLFHVPIGVFHAANEERRRLWPNSMLATATHDTKRGEDARARLNVLSELDDWSAVARRWRRFNRRWRIDIDGQRTPSLADEYMIYQALLGAWPAQPADTGSDRPDELSPFRERVKGFVTKAVREAKSISSWSNPNEAYEQGCLDFIDAILDNRERNIFFDDIQRFAARITTLGALNGLSQLVLKCASPGVPDIYQGDELWDLNLVDPDNRRPVDFSFRASILDQFADGIDRIGSADSGAVANLMCDWPSGKIKLYVLRRLLMLRDRMSALFRDGSYEPLRAVGERADHVISFARRHSEGTLVVATGRWFNSVLDADKATYPGNSAWSDSRIEADGLSGIPFVDVLTGQRIQSTLREGTETFAVQELLTTLPVAVLMSAQSEYGAGQGP